MEEKKKFHYLDLRLPLGILLTFYGVLLTLYGLITDPEVYNKSLRININLLWGLVLFTSGGFLILFLIVKGLVRKWKKEERG